MDDLRNGPADGPVADDAPAARLAGWLRASPAELAGLAVLLLGAVAVSAVLWLQAAQRPSTLGGEAATAGASVAADRTTDGPAPGVEGDASDPEVAYADAGSHGHAPSAGPDGAADGHPPAPDAVGTATTVHVTGAVASPGLVVLPEGGRVGDAVRAAGGLTDAAQPEWINLARPVLDGEHVHVPREDEEPPVAMVDPPSGPAQGTAAGDGPVTGGVGADGRVDLNRAAVSELETLPGIGPARAEAIVAHREQHGPFTSPGDLRAVSGIGEVIFQRLAELVTVG